MVVTCAIVFGINGNNLRVFTDDDAETARVRDGAIVCARDQAARERCRVLADRRAV